MHLCFPTLPSEGRQSAESCRTSFCALTDTPWHWGDPQVRAAWAVIEAGLALIDQFSDSVFSERDEPFP